VRVSTVPRTRGPVNGRGDPDSSRPCHRAAIITSMPGLAELTGARILADIGDDRARFADARGLKAYAAALTRASGKSTAVLHRRVKDQRLA